LEHLQYEILTPESAFLNTFFKFFEVEIWSVFFYPEEAIIEFFVFLFTDKILSLNFFAFRMNKFLHFSISP